MNYNSHLFYLILRGIKTQLVGDDNIARKKEIHHIIKSSIEEKYEATNFCDIDEFSDNLSNAIIELRDAVAGNLNVKQFEFLLKNLLNTSGDQKTSILLSSAKKTNTLISDKIIEKFIKLDDIIKTKKEIFILKNNKNKNSTFNTGLTLVKNIFSSGKKQASSFFSSQVKKIQEKFNDLKKSCDYFTFDSETISPIKNILKTVGIFSVLIYYTPGIVAFKTSYNLIKKTMPKRLELFFTILNGLFFIIGYTFPNITYRNELKNYISYFLENHPIESMLLLNSAAIIEYNLDDLKFLLEKAHVLTNTRNVETDNTIDEINASSKTYIPSKRSTCDLKSEESHLPISSKDRSYLPAFKH